MFDDRLYFCSCAEYEICVLYKNNHDTHNNLDLVKDDRALRDDEKYLAI